MFTVLKGGMLGLLAAVAGGALLHGWSYIPPPQSNPTRSGAQSPAGVVISASSDRLGQASAASALKLCMTSEVHSAGDPPAARAGYASRSRPYSTPFPDPSGSYKIMESDNRDRRIAGLIGMKATPEGTLEIASIWAAVTRCVYNQDSSELCDRDNRALAVDSINSFLRHADYALSDTSNAKWERQKYQITFLRATKDQVMTAFRSHLRDGALISQDFGMLAPEAVKRVANETRPIRDICARKS
jgi:hypothetical protein